MGETVKYAKNLESQWLNQKWPYQERAHLMR